MSSSYLNLYQGAGGFYTRNILGMEQRAPAPTYGWGGFGQQRGTYRAGAITKVVHDKYNNMYYGQTKQTDVVKGIQDSIKRIQGQLTRKGETVYSTGWMGALNTSYRNYSAADRKQQNASIARLNKDLKHVQSGGYKQEGNKFFESYDAYTGDWNNVFKRRKSNADRVESNRLQVIENKKIARRNKKIEGENQVREAQALKQQDTKMTTGSNAMPKSLKPKLTINTGVTANADKLVKSLNTGLSI